MKKYSILPIKFAFVYLLFIASLFIFSLPVSAALLKLSPSSGEISQSSEIDVIIDTEGEAVESSAAVISFDPTKVEITDLFDGGFFDDLTADTSQEGEIAITGTLNIGDIEGKSGGGTLATLVLSPKITSGNIALYFRCSGTEMDDSNILSVEGTDLLATDEQCARNVEGSYTVSSSSTTDTTNTSNTSNDTTDTSTDTTDTTTETNTSTASQTTSTDDTTKGGQPVMPEELPQSGPQDWLRWIVSGLAFIGIGLLLF